MNEEQTNKDGSLRDTQFEERILNAIRLYADFVCFQQAIDETNHLPETFISRCKEAADFALAIAKLRNQQTHVGFIPLSLSDYLQRLAKLANVAWSLVCELVGIKDANHLDQSSVSNFTQLAMLIGLSLRETLIHARISFAQQVEGAPVMSIAARRRDNKITRNINEELELTLSGIEAQYGPDNLSELRCIEAAIMKAYEMND